MRTAERPGRPPARTSAGRDEPEEVRREARVVERGRFPTPRDLERAPAAVAHGVQPRVEVGEKPVDRVVVAALRREGLLPAGERTIPGAARGDDAEESGAGGEPLHTRNEPQRTLRGQAAADEQDEHVGRPCRG